MIFDVVNDSIRKMKLPSYVIAMIKAIGVWICVYYIFIAHCFVIWKWQTPRIESIRTTATNTTIQQQQQMSTIEQEYYMQLHNRILKLNQTVQFSHQRMEILLQQQQQLARPHKEINDSSSTITSESSIQLLLQSLESNMTQLHLLPSSTHYREEEEKEVVSTVEALRKVLLLRHTSTKTSTGTPNNSKQKLLISSLEQQAMYELQQLIDYQNWDVLQTLIDTLPVAVDATNHETDAVPSNIGQCTATAPEVNKKQSEYVTKQYLQDQLQNIQNNIFLSQQHASSGTGNSNDKLNQLPVSFYSTIIALQDMVQTIVQETLSDLLLEIEHSSDESIDDVNEAAEAIGLNDGAVDTCSSSTTSSLLVQYNSLIEDWVNIGLETIYQSIHSEAKVLDIRRALLSVMMTSGVTIGLEDPMSIINNMYNITNSKKKNEQQQSLAPNSHLQHEQIIGHAINLRQLLDRPSLYKLSFCIDVVLEYLCSVNDILDDYINQYIYNNPQLIQTQQKTTSIPAMTQSPNTGNTLLVGPILVEHFLNVLGHVTVPAATNTSHIKEFISTSIFSKLTKKN